MNKEAEQIMLKVSTAKKWMVDYNSVKYSTFSLVEPKCKVVDTAGKVIYPKLAMKDAQAIVSEHNDNLVAMRALMSMGMNHQIAIDSLKKKINQLEDGRS